MPKEEPIFGLFLVFSTESDEFSRHCSWKIEQRVHEPEHKERVGAALKGVMS